MVDNGEQEVEGASGGGGFQIELVKSYLAFVKHAVRVHWIMAAVIFAMGLVLTVLTAKYIPRTYHCASVTMGDGTDVLEHTNYNPFGGAENLILRHDNLETIIRDTGLMRKYFVRRPPLLQLKDRISASLSGPMSDEALKDVLIGTLEGKLQISASNSELRVSADWTDPKTAAELVEAARNSFLNNRHSTEVSAFQDKMAILDEHASNLRREIDGLAQQIKAVQEQKVVEAKKGAPAASGSASPAPPLRIVRRLRPAATATDPVPAALSSKLVELKRQLADADGDRQRRLQAEEGKLAEMKLRLAPAHPEIIQEQQLIAMLSQVPPDVRQRQAEIDAVEQQIDEHSRAAHPLDGTTSSMGSGRATGAADGEPLPTEIVRLLEDDGVDPILASQLSGAMSKYGELRSELRSSRIALDTAQAAFNYRYKIVIPAEVPTSPSKPKIPVIVLGGLVASFFLAVLLPLVSELRHGIMIERWQVHMVALPVLAELKLPPRSD